MPKKATNTVRANGATSSVVKMMQEMAIAMADLASLSGRDEPRYWKYDLRKLSAFEDRLINIRTILANKRAKLSNQVNDNFFEAQKDNVV